MAYFSSITVTLGSPISDTAHLGSDGATGTITFHLLSDSSCTTEVDTGLEPVTVNGSGDYSSGDYLPTQAGTYYWTAEYGGESTHEPATTNAAIPARRPS